MSDQPTTQGIVRLPTGSALHRAMNCPASCALASYGRTTEEAIEGTNRHSEMEEAVLLQDWTKLKPHIQSMLQAVIGDGAVIAVERTYALDVEKGTARLLGDRLERKYDAAGRTPTEICATIDLVVRRRDGVLVVADWKSRKRVSSAYDNWQMRAAAMGAVAVETGHKGDVIMALGYMDDGEVDETPEPVDMFDVSAWWHELFALRDKLRGAPSTMIHEGPWCDYCSCMNVCPTKTQLALAMLGELNVAGQIVEMSAEQAGRVYEKAKAANDIVERVLSAVKDRAKHEPIPLPNGKRLVMVEIPGRESLDRDTVEKVFAAIGKPLPMKRGAPFTTPKEQNAEPKKRNRKKEST